jgi:hypothetical protein
LPHSNVRQVMFMPKQEIHHKVRATGVVGVGDLDQDRKSSFDLRKVPLSPTFFWGLCQLLWRQSRKVFSGFNHKVKRMHESKRILIFGRRSSGIDN